MNSKIIPPGTGGRWAIGVIVLTHLIAFDETGGPGAVFATIIAAVSAIFSGICKTSLKSVQLPYLRTTHRIDFLYLFLAVWMDFLALLAACGALARTLSTCLDAMTGGLARMYILGRNSPANEPWPDVFGVAVIFLVTGMFMLGLENTRIFSVLMVAGVLGLSGIISMVTWLRGTETAWKTPLVPAGFPSVLASGAIVAFSYPSEFSVQGSHKKLFGLLIISTVFLSNILTAGCLSTLFGFTSNKEFSAVPIITIIRERSYEKVIPAIACLLVIACSGAILELFPEMYNLIVKLTTSEYKILARQIGYENRDSGSPVLAVFIAGSLCAMLAFACPLQIMTHILAASNLMAIMLRAMYLLYSPYRPKFIQQPNESSLSYSRLNTGNSSQEQSSTSSIGLRLKRTLDFINKSTTSVNQIVPKSRSKSKLNKTQNQEEMEREWLLLGEPPSPRCVSHPTHDEESSILSDGEQQTSDIECIAKENTDSDSSTDIDAIVDEYRQKVKVSTAGPMESLSVPSLMTWHLTMVGIFIIWCSIITTSFGIFVEELYITVSGIGFGFTTTILIMWLPKYKNTQYSPSSMICVISLYFSSILIIFVLDLSWPAIIFWLVSGIILYIRCDTWCCLCLDHPRQAHQQLIPNVSSKLATIRVPCPPKGALIQGRMTGHR